MKKKNGAYFWPRRYRKYFLHGVSDKSKEAIGVRRALQIQIKRDREREKEEKKDREEGFYSEGMRKLVLRVGRINKLTQKGHTLPSQPTEEASLYPLLHEFQNSDLW